MPQRQFPNYLRTFRKRSGLSQDEVAFLLGGENGGMVSRYEQFNRAPSLETACDLEALFGIPVRDLFAGTFAKRSRRMAQRARLLEKKLESAHPLTTQKLNTIRSISQALNHSTES